jgi:hypothetical protein
MDAFDATLRDRVRDVQRAVRQARAVGDGHREQAFGDQLAELLDVGRRHGVDMAGWVDRDILAGLYGRDGRSG